MVRCPTPRVRVRARVTGEVIRSEVPPHLGLGSVDSGKGQGQG